jgi:hypothetical protein
MKVYMGWDEREVSAYVVASRTLKNTSGINPEPLSADRLRSVGLYTRDIDKRDGRFYDMPSGAPCSTEFASSRFLTPIICQTGWALFVDCDVVFYRDVHELLSVADTTKAVWVVKHQMDVKEGQTKMDGQPQTRYSRKNWSSVMLFNCNHPANRRLTFHDVNNRPGRELHSLYWLNDSEIGDLPRAWNWLVGHQTMPDNVGIAHFTNGGPWISGWKERPYDDLWKKARADVT